MSFIPFLGLLPFEARKREDVGGVAQYGFMGWYYRVAKHSIEHRWKFFAGSLVFLVIGVWLFGQLKSAFFPEDVQYWSYIDVWLPNDANLEATNQTAVEVERVVREEAQRYGQEHPGKDGKPADVLRYVTTFVGGGGPRFWFSASPQLQQLNYAQVLIELKDKEATPEFIKSCSRA